MLVYPGGDYEVHRPSWERNRVDFGGRKGFIRLAIEQDVPIVPGRRRRRAGDGAVPLARRAPGAARSGLDRLFRLKVLPLSLALPWGLNVGDLLGHIPLPAKITVEALPPIHLREEFGARARRRRGLRARRAADAGDARGARRRAPLPGARMRIAEHVDVARAARDRLGAGQPTPRGCSTSSPASRAGSASAGRGPGSARATGC